MLRGLPLVIVAMICVCLSGCKNDSEAAMSGMIDKIKDMTKILKDVKDKDSAIAAKPKLEALNKEMNEFMSQMMNKKVNEEEAKKASEKYKAEGEAAMNAWTAEMTRIAGIPGASQALGAGLPMGGFGAFK